MKRIKNLTAAVLAISVLAGPFAALAGEAKTEVKAKPYPLKTCIVSGEKLGEMGKAFTFVYEGQEIKLCCPDCQKDFKKEPAKYLKKMKELAAKEKKAKT